MLTEDDLEEIRDRVSEVSDQHYADFSDVNTITFRDGYFEVGGAIVPVQLGSSGNYGQQARVDAVFYATAKGDVLSLLDEVERLNGLIAELEEKIEQDRLRASLDATARSES